MLSGSQRSAWGSDERRVELPHEGEGQMSRAILMMVVVGVTGGLLLVACCKGNAPDDKTSPAAAPTVGTDKAATPEEEAAKQMLACIAVDAELAVQANQTAKAFFEACAREDWEAVKQLAPPTFQRRSSGSRCRTGTADWRSWS